MAQAAAVGIGASPDVEDGVPGLIAPSAHAADISTSVARAGRYLRAVADDD